MDRRLEELGQLWDSLVDCSRSQESSALLPPLCYPLMLHKEPNIRYLPRHPRKLNQIDANLRRAMRELIQGQRPWPLVIKGGVGTGKTSAALCLLDYTCGCYFTVESLMQDAAASMHGRMERGPSGDKHNVYQEEFWSIIENAPLVILDELGTRSTVTDHHYVVVKRLLDLRVGRPLVVIANVELEDIQALYDIRIASRLVSGTIFQLDGKDQRFPANGTGQERRNGQKAGN